jgi:hypothetical protein
MPGAVPLDLGWHDAGRPCSTGFAQTATLPERTPQAAELMQSLLHTPQAQSRS